MTVKFIYSEKSTKFCEISTLLLSYVVPVKNKVKISQNFVDFSEYMNFISILFEKKMEYANMLLQNFFDRLCLRNVPPGKRTCRWRKRRLDQYLTPFEDWINNEFPFLLKTRHASFCQCYQLVIKKPFNSRISVSIW